MRRGAWKASKRASVLGAVAFFVFACGGIDPNELECEEAVSHLGDCCPEVDVRRFQCDEQQTGCRTSSPDFYEKASQCIHDRSCDELREQGKCEAFKQIANTPYPSNNHDQIEVEACK